MSSLRLYCLSTIGLMNVMIIKKDTERYPFFDLRLTKTQNESLIIRPATKIKLE